MSNSSVVLVSYGAGTNSTAMLIGLHERGERPDAILFADTGGERPETYAYVQRMSRWCVEHGFPAIESIVKGGRKQTLEEDCLEKHVLPSVVYGFKKCSQKYKIEPQEKWANNNEQCRAIWKAGGTVTKLIGIDANEEHRARISDDKKTTFRYPLIEWGWGRDECVEVIRDAGLCQPGKSSCFFCPSMRKPEIRALAVTHPDLMARALAIEANAETHTVVGLGRHFRWADLLATPDMFADEYFGIDEPCGCYDG